MRKEPIPGKRVLHGMEQNCFRGAAAAAGPRRGSLAALLFAAVFMLFFAAGFSGMTAARADAFVEVSNWAQMQKALNSRVSGKVYITVWADLTISGGNAHNNGNNVEIDLRNHTIDGAKSQQAFWNESGSLTIKNGTIQNCRTDRGGAINNRADLTLENVVITGCVGNIEAGGIMNYGTLTMTGGKVTNCQSSRGGGIRVRPFNSSRASIATLTNVEISSNQADGRQDDGDGRYGRGGGIAVTNGTLTMTGCTVSGNKSTDDDGGGIDFDASGKILTLTNTVFSNNQATQSDREGGGLNLERGSAVITGCTFTGNSARGDGGAIAIAESFGTAELSGCTITGNTSKDHSGGGIMNKATLTLKGTNTITGNTAKEQGAGVYFAYNGKSMNIEGDLRISDNHLTNGYDKNLFLARNKTLNITGNLAGSALIGVTPENMSQTPTVITSGEGGTTVTNFENDDGWITEKKVAGPIQMRLSAPLSGDELNRATVSFHPMNQHSGLCIRDNGGGAGQNVVQLYNLGDSFRFWLTRADSDSYYIDFFGGAHDYDPSNKRLDISDNGGYGTVGNVVHVVFGDKEATNKRWRFYRNADGTYFIQNKRSGLFWALENSNYDDKNKLCQRGFGSAQKWQMEIVHADATSGVPIDDQTKLTQIKPFDSFCFEYQGKNVQGNNWMGCLPDNLLITDVSIPGVHDAATAHTHAFNAFAQCQQLSIMDQMTSGVRYFDLRARLSYGDRLKMYHGVDACEYKGDTLELSLVMTWIYNFLQTNPGETVIIQPKNEAGEEIGKDSDKALYEYFRDEAEKYPERWYIGDHVPTLGEVRGKILIMSRIKKVTDDDFNKKSSGRYAAGVQWAMDAKRWVDWSNDYSSTLALTSETEKYQIWTQDKYDTYGDDKWKIIVNSVFNTAAGPMAKQAAAKTAGKNAWVVSYTSCVRTYPQNAARDLNPRLKNKLMTDPNVLAGQFLGVVCSDFTDQQLAYLVYKQNFIEKQELPHTEHTPETRETSTTATCTQPGTRVVETYCSVCGQIISTTTETIPALGHDWCDPEYTWEKTGDTYRVTASHICDRDNSHTESETVQATSDEAVAATCEGTGARTWTAVFTKEDFGTAGMIEEIPALGHEWGEWEVVRNPSTTETGLERRTCRHDATHVEEHVLPMLTPSAFVYLVLQEADGSWPEPAQPHSTATGNYTPGDIDDYTISGWSTAFQSTDTGRTACSSGTAVEIPATAEKLYIYYTRNTYDLVFRLDIAGTRVWKTEKVRWDAPLSAYKAMGFSDENRYPNQPDHTMAGWSRTPKTSGDYSSSDDLSSILYVFSGRMPKETMNLYPVLIPDPVEDDPTLYYIIFDANGGKFADNTSIKEVSGKRGSLYPIPDDPTREGWVFQGWSTNGSTITPPVLYMPKGGWSYKAVWHQHTAGTPVKENVIPDHCEKDGSYDMVTYCTRCHQEMFRTHYTLEKTGHNWGSWTRMNRDQHIRICANYRAHREVADHNWVEVTTTKPTCTQPGLVTYTCSDCGAEKTRTLSATGEHNWVEVEGGWEPTCTEAGTQKWKCEVCGLARTEILPANGHTWDDGTETVAPTCTAAGVLTRSCIHCDAAQTETIAPLGHEWDSWMVSRQATDTEDGLEISYCRRDESHMQSRIIPRMRVVPPEAVRGLYYTGLPQTLVTPGRVTGGEMQYVLGNENEAQTTDWSAILTSGTEEGIYYTWYRVKGDDRYAHVASAGPVATMISEEAFSYQIVSVKNPTHTIQDGNNTVVTVERSVRNELAYPRFKQVLLDGNAVNPANYSTRQGSLILTLKAAYLDTLTVGDHKLTIAFEDGSATATIKIKEAAPAPTATPKPVPKKEAAPAPTATPKPVPKTGDGSNPALWLGLAVAGLILIAGTMMLWNRKKRCGK